MKKMSYTLSSRVAVKGRNGHMAFRSKAGAFPGVTTTTGAFRGFAIKDFCKIYAITRDTFTRLTGFSPRAVAHWVQGRKPSASTERRLTEMKRIFEALETLVTKDAIGPWLKESNPAFGDSTPLQVIERGETDRVWRMIYELQSGEPG
jgi:hypothetical protein